METRLYIPVNSSFNFVNADLISASQPEEMSVTNTLLNIARDVDLRKIYRVAQNKAEHYIFILYTIYSRPTSYRYVENYIDSNDTRLSRQESPANAKGTRDSSAYVKAHCEQM